ncbi:SMI1 [Candida jiufengensis]|uniref:SMI1 n=1 Tax=Candida jiufengensis TaxID=497108 RepID=UPI002225ACCF|nr:SMI1 [Candida jiufengensis]KAI5951491.1 SMI1 [Candida jiufengensis]
MGLLDNFKAFVHSITTDDHYASYDSPFKSKKNDPTSLNDQSNNPYPNESSLNLNSDINMSTQSLHNQESSGGFYRPGMRSSQSKLNVNVQQQDVPLQNFDSNGLPPLPSIDSLWDRIESWIEEEYPELEDNLNDGVTTADLNEFLQDLKCGSTKLPDEFRQFYKRHDGQLRGGKPTGLIMGLVLLDLESIVEENILWNKVAERIERQYYMMQHQQQQQDDNNIKEGSSSSNSHHQIQQQKNSFITNQRSIPPNSIQPYYYHKSWIILLKDNIGNQIAMDLNPGPNGNWGQIILFGRDFDTKLVIASNLQEFIFDFVSDLEQGNFLIDSSEFQEQLGYLSHDRDGDYVIGDEDENQGELNFFDKDGKEFGKNNIRGRTNYIEILKKRALKKYGLTENFQTTYQVPKIINSKKNNSSIINSGRNSPYQSKNNSTTSVNASSSNLNNNGKNKPSISSPLINVDNNSTFSIPKETIIDKNKEKVETVSKVKDDKKEELTNDIAAAKLNDNLEELKIDEDEKAAEPVKVAEEPKIEVEKNTPKEEEPKVEENSEVKVDDKEEEEKEEKEAEGELEDSTTTDNKPLTKSQKKNQKKKAKKQQQQLEEN